MRVLHTSDWHLGRTLHGVDLLPHQAAFCDHLVELVTAEGIDAVVIAGDVYDRAIPPVEAVALLSDVLARLSDRAEVVLTSGNHDSAIRLGFGADLMRAGVHVRTRAAGVGAPVLLRGRPGARGGSAPLLVYPLPYLDPDAARVELADDEPLARSHYAVMSAAMARVSADLERRRAADPAVRALAMAHVFVVGAAASDSERDIRVGGVDAVPADVFDAGLDYVALGHLHGAQTVASRGREIGRYSGSPLAFSFSEMHQHKSTALLDLDAGSVELVPCPVPRRLAEVRGTLDELLADDAHAADWLRVIVTDDLRPAELYSRVRAHFPHALQVLHEPAGRPERGTARAVTPGRDAVEVVGEFVEHVTGHPPEPPEAAVLRAAVEAARAAERSA